MIDPEVMRRLEQQASLIRQLQGAFGEAVEVRAFASSASGAIGAQINAGASVSKTATGRYTVTWTRPWASANYVVVGSCFQGASGIGIWSVAPGVTYNETQFGCSTVNNDAFADLAWFCIAIGPIA